MNVSILVPVYRAEATLPELHRQLSAVMPTLVDDHEIIFVEDCGGDNSWRVITNLAVTDPRVRGIRMSATMASTTRCWPAFAPRSTKSS